MFGNKTIKCSRTSKKTTHNVTVSPDTSSVNAFRIVAQQGGLAAGKGKRRERW